MWTEYLIGLKAELLAGLLLFVLLYIKIFASNIITATLLNFVNLLLLVNLVLGFMGNLTGELFGGAFRINSLLAFEKNLLNLGILIISLQAQHWLVKHEHALEFYMLLLSTQMGMFFLISSGNMLVFYLGLELSTIPLAALANFDLGKRKSSEAAFKLILSSAFSSGLLLFGISILYGATGTIEFSEMGLALQPSPLLIFGFLLFFAGLGFKISAVPFHLWTADVYEGAPAAVTSYLSVISKGGILFLMVSVLFTVFSGIAETWQLLIRCLAVASLITGNLFALRQQNMKRLLAFSSIAQVGFILVGISGYSTLSHSSVVYFMLIYIFSNLGAFGVISIVSTLAGKENIADYRGFYKHNKGLSWVLAIALFSLAGIPPVAGFFGKYFLLLAGAAKGQYWLIIFAALNMVVSLYYYLRVIKAIFIDENEHPIARLNVNWQPKLSLVICMAGMLLTGFATGLFEYIVQLVEQLR